MKRLYISAAALILFSFVSCSPVDRVKWGSVDLFGNEIRVSRIVGAMAGSNGRVNWSSQGRDVRSGHEIVMASIKRPGMNSLLRFIYDSDKGVSHVIHFEENGEALPPFLIYSRLNR